MVPIPMFPPPQLPFPSLDYLVRAELFRDSAYRLVDITGGQPNWPKYFLQGHAVELALKSVAMSFEERTGQPAARPMPQRHDILGYYRVAVNAGMRKLPHVEDLLGELADLHEEHHARYPKQARQVTLSSYFDDPTQEILQAASDVVRRFK